MDFLALAKPLQIPTVTGHGTPMVNSNDPRSKTSPMQPTEAKMQTPKAGGIRPCSLAFGADQLDQRNDPNNENNSNRVLEKFFSWYFAATAVSVVIAFTGIVYVQDRARWKMGFVVPAVLMFLSALLCSFFLLLRFYIKQKATVSLFTSFAQVVVVAYKNKQESRTSISGLEPLEAN